MKLEEAWRWADVDSVIRRFVFDSPSISIATKSEEIGPIPKRVLKLLGEHVKCDDWGIQNWKDYKEYVEPVYCEWPPPPLPEPAVPKFVVSFIGSYDYVMVLCVENDELEITMETDDEEFGDWLSMALPREEIKRLVNHLQFYLENGKLKEDECAQ